MIHAREHFSKTVDDYDTVVDSVVLENDRMHDVAIAALSGARPLRRVLDVGCGTGHSMELALERFPDVFIEGVDFSERMIALARRRLERFTGRFDLHLCDCLELQPAEPFDSVISVITLHNLPLPGKQVMFRRISSWLAPGGRFVNADFYRGETPERHEELLGIYLSHVRSRLKGEELDVWLEHIATDDPLRLSDLKAELRDAGLEGFALRWLHGNQAVVTGDRPGSKELA